MVKKIKDLYKCEECGLSYKEEVWATKCQEWCKKNHTCHLDIIKHSANVAEENS